MKSCLICEYVLAGQPYIHWKTKEKVRCYVCTIKHCRLRNNGKQAETCTYYRVKK